MRRLLLHILVASLVARCRADLVCNPWIGGCQEQGTNVATPETCHVCTTAGTGMSFISPGPSSYCASSPNDVPANACYNCGGAGTGSQPVSEGDPQHANTAGLVCVSFCGYYGPGNTQLLQCSPGSWISAGTVNSDWFSTRGLHVPTTGGTDASDCVAIPLHGFVNSQLGKCGCDLGWVLTYDGSSVYPMFPPDRTLVLGCAAGPCLTGNNVCSPDEVCVATSSYSNDYDCVGCAIGMTAPPNATDVSQCICKDGYVANSTSTTTTGCIPGCATGQHIVPETGSCAPCPVDTYSAAVGNETMCTACHTSTNHYALKTYDLTGATTSAACRCPAYFVKQASTSIPGTFDCISGNGVFVTPIGSANATACPRNSYCVSPSLPPLECPAGSTSVGSSAVCSCSAGQTWARGAHRQPNTYAPGVLQTRGSCGVTCGVFSDMTWMPDRGDACRCVTGSETVWDYQSVVLPGLHSTHAVASIALASGSTDLVVLLSGAGLIRVSQNGTVTDFAGGSEIGFTDGMGSMASWFVPEELAGSPTGDIYMTDTHNHAIRMITPVGVVSTFAGNNNNAEFRNGPLDEARLGSPKALWVDPVHGVIYFGQLDPVSQNVSRLTSTHMEAFGSDFGNQILLSGFINGDILVAGRTASYSLFRVSPTGVIVLTMPTAVGSMGNIAVSRAQQDVFFVSKDNGGQLYRYVENAALPIEVHGAPNNNFMMAASPLGDGIYGIHGASNFSKVHLYSECSTPVTTAATTPVTTEATTLTTTTAATTPVTTAATTLATTAATTPVATEATTLATTTPVTTEATTLATTTAATTPGTTEETTLATTTDASTLATTTVPTTVATTVPTTVPITAVTTVPTTPSITLAPPDPTTSQATTPTVPTTVPAPETPPPLESFQFWPDATVSFEYALHSRQNGIRIPTGLNAAGRLLPLVPQRPRQARTDGLQFIGPEVRLTSTTPAPFDPPMQIFLILDKTAANVDLSRVCILIRSQVTDPWECLARHVEAVNDGYVAWAEVTHFTDFTVGLQEPSSGYGGYVVLFIALLVLGLIVVGLCVFALPCGIPYVKQVPSHCDPEWKSRYDRPLEWKSKYDQPLDADPSVKWLLARGKEHQDSLSWS
jgi:hypothetical protein